MYCKINKARNLSVFVKAILIFQVLTFYANNIQANSSDSSSFSNLNFEDTIYVFTNRSIDTISDVIHFNNDVNVNAGLTILRVSKDKAGKLTNHLININDFFAQTSKKKSDWLLFVHGDSKTYNQSVKRGLDIQLSHKLNVIVFSWSSKEPDFNGLKNLNNSKRNLIKSMDHFIELLDYMESFKKLNPVFQEGKNLSILLHSLGNFYLENLVKNNLYPNKTDTIFSNMILNSAAVNQKNHHEWVKQINIQERIYITNNKYDFTLKGLHIFSKSGNQLGEKAKKQIAENAKYISFTKSVGFRFPTGQTHTYFIGNVPRESKNIRNFYFDIFHGYQIDLTNETQFLKSSNKPHYHIVY